GVVGLKPTYGRVSRYGLIAYASSFECIGQLTKSVEDAALLLEVIAGPDEYDSTVSSTPISFYSKELEWKGKAKIGYLVEGVESEAVQPEVKEQMQVTLDRLKEEGHEVEPVKFNQTRLLFPTY